MLKKRRLAQSRGHMVMTLPDERYRAVRSAEEFLQDMAAGRIQRVPRAVREQARSILRHYPNKWDLDMAARSAPGVFCEHMEPLHRMVLARDLQQLSDPECMGDNLESDSNCLQQGYRD